MMRAHWADGEIRRFRRLDDARGSDIGRASCVFVGSSIFREWRELRDFEGDWTRRAGGAARAAWVNRAFGGAETSDLLTFEEDVLGVERGRDVRVIVYYCGSNDLSVGGSPRTVRDNFAAFAERARRRARRRVGVVFVGVIDSPQKRMYGLSGAVRETNELCAAWCEKTPDSAFVDVTSVFEDVASGATRPLFREDGTHLKTEAYEGLMDVIAPKVVELFHAVSREDSRASASVDADESFLPPSMRR